MICPLHNGNPPHDAMAPRFAVSAPNSTVMKVRARSTADPGRKPGELGSPRTAISRAASNSIAVARCRITRAGVRPVFTVTAPRMI